MLFIWLILSPVVLQVLCALPANQHHGNARNRTLREEKCSEDEYWHQGHCCKNCRMGFHVSRHCTGNHGHSVCEPCTAGEDYTVGPNGLENCISCDTCTRDKVSVRECTPEANAICQCKPEYYCRPDGPCEICSRCSRCGEGQRISKQCTPTTDTVCEDVSAPDPISTKANVTDKPKAAVSNDLMNDATRRRDVPDNPSDDQAGSQTYLYIIFILGGLLVIIVISVIIIFGYKYYKRKFNENSKNSLLGITQNSQNTSLDSVRTDEKDPKEEELPPEHQPLVSAGPRRHEQLILQKAAPCLVEAQRDPAENHFTNFPEAEGDIEWEESPEVGKPCEICQKLQPCDTQWSDFFYIVIDNVDQKHMTQLVRKLHLPRNTIDQVSNDNSNDCKEKCYQFLEKWREQNGKQASMKAVLKQLYDMELAGCCENITNNLRTKNIPIN